LVSIALKGYSSAIAHWSQKKAYFLTIEAPEQVCDLFQKPQIENIRVLLK
jgi:hypothetical protein